MTDKPDDKARIARGKTAKPVGDILGKVMEPVLARKSGMTVSLIKAWGELVGEEFRHCTKPERIDWPRRSNEDDPFEPATLIVACDNASALFFQHEQTAVLERINLFFGFEAVKRMKINQKPVHQTDADTSKPVKSISPADEAQLAEMLDEIDNQTLKNTMMKLGRGVMAQSR